MNKTAWSRVFGTDLLMLCFSISVSIVGQMLTPIGEAYSLNLLQKSWLISSQSIGGLSLALIAIFYSGMNKERFVLISGTLLGVMFLLIGIGLPVFLLFVIFALIGYSGGTINALSNSVISDNVPQGRVDRHISLLHMTFSLGAVITPLLSQFLYKKNGLNGVFLVFSAFIILSVIYAYVAFRKQVAVRPVKKRLKLKQRIVDAVGILKKPGMATVFTLAVLISAVQLCLVYFASTYFSQIGGSGDFGALALSTLFLCMMVSRLLYSRIAGRFSKGVVLAAANILTFICLGIMILVTGAVAKLVFLALGSFFYANNMPIVFSSAMDAAPNSKASATGIVILGYYFALLLFLPAAGSVGEAYGLDAAMASMLLPMLVSIAVGFVLHKKNKTKSFPE